MFVPDHYHAPDASWSWEVVRRNPLGLLVTNGGKREAPHATHLPVILEPGSAADPGTDLVGATLLGHLNRANPHWAALGPDTPAVIAFSGPHGYVSPTVYGVTPAAPTWNFTAVHVHGTISPVDEPEETLEVVRSTVRAFERDFGDGWDMSDSLDHFRRILPAVGAFRLRVRRVDGMFKLGQDLGQGLREKVRQSFEHRTGGGYGEIAELMGRLAPTEAAGRPPAQGRTGEPTGGP